MSADLLAVCACSAVGSALAVWGVVRHELHAIRQEVRRAHVRVDGHLVFHGLEVEAVKR